MNRNTTSTLQRNAWLYGIKFKPTSINKKKQADVLEELGSVQFEGYRNGDPNQGRKKKSFPMFGNNDQFETELFINNNVDFIEFAEEVGWDGRDRIFNYRDILEGKLKKTYKKVGWEGTSDNYDPNHANAETPEGFVRLLGATFMEFTGHDNPAYALQEKIKNMNYSNHRQHDTHVDPKIVKERLEELWDVVEMLPGLNGWQQADEHEKLNAVFYGLPEDAQDYLKYEKEVDVFDAANNGANEYSWQQCLMAIRPWWVKNFKKTAEENAKKRDRQDDDVEDDDRSNKRRKQNTDRNDDDNEDEQDEEEEEQDDDEHQDDYSTYSTDDEHQDDDSTQNQEDQRGRSHANESDDDKQLSFFDKPCLIHQDHPYNRCNLCFTGRQFNRAEADKYYQHTDSHSQGWWRRTYERKFPQQEQQQSYYQQYTAPPGQVAPTFATGTAAPTGAAAQARPQLFQMVQDSAGKSYFVQM